MRKITLVAAGAALAAVPLMGSAFAAGNTTSNINQTMYHVGQNPADCSLDPSAQPVTAKSGQAVIHVNAKSGTTVLDVSFSGAVPNATYVVDIRCVGQIGSLVTDAYGNGSDEILLNSSQTSSSFSIDAAQPPGTGGTGVGGYGDTFVSAPFSALGG